ncbi:MAG: hypothetical protein QOE70_5197 [Chthoniobacter sp.]|jgi:hypothetical protein|nr:hypothetical protein [Chthoniobacter sp.]
MKKLTPSFLALLGLIGTSLAGTTVYSGKETKSVKQVVAPPPPTCFDDRELQIDTFGQASYGSESHIGMFRDVAVGGGVGLNYFFHRNIGLGVDAAWLSAKENALAGPVDADHDRTVLHNFSGSLIFRLPIDSACLAPYAYVGGGFHVDGEQWASGHAGLGVEWRIVPHKVGIFLDERWTYLGDRFEERDLNFWSTRLGVRLVF